MDKEKNSKDGRDDSDRPIYKGKEAEDFIKRWTRIRNQLKGIKQ